MLLENPNLAGSRAKDLFSVPKVLTVDCCGLLFVFRDEVGPSDEGRVNRVKGKHGKERLLLVGLHELAGVAGKAVREMFAIWAVAQTGIAIRRKVFLSTIGATCFEPSRINIVSVFGRPEFFGRTKVPFPSKEGGVTLFFKSFGKSCFIVVEAIVKRRTREFPTTSATEEIGAILAGGVAAGLDPKAGG